MADGSSGIKTESSAAGLTAQVFKAEPVGDGGVDLENDAYVFPFFLFSSLPFPSLPFPSYLHSSPPLHFRKTRSQRSNTSKPTASIPPTKTSPMSYPSISLFIHSSINQSTRHNATTDRRIATRIPFHFHFIFHTRIHISSSCTPAPSMPLAIHLFIPTHFHNPPFLFFSILPLRFPIDPGPTHPFHKESARSNQHSHRVWARWKKAKRKGKERKGKGRKRNTSYHHHCCRYIPTSFIPVRI